jgi:hypothetical protein
VRRRLHHGPEIGGERKQRSRQGLGRAVACEKRIVIGPSGADPRRLQ